MYTVLIRDISQASVSASGGERIIGGTFGGNGEMCFILWM